MTGAKCKKNSVLAKNIEKNRNTKQRLKQAKGITLIALVITIVILIILATVTMSFVFGEDGLIARAEQAAEMTEAQNILEQMELAKAEVAMENGGKVDADDFFEKLEENGVIGSVENDVVDNGDGTYDIVTEDGDEFEITVTPEGDIEIEYNGKGDEPRIRNISITKTSNSVTITVETKNADGGKFTYSYKKNSEGEESWQEADANTTSSTCTISNLEANEIYNIKVKLETDKGTVERTVNVQVGEMPVGKVNFGDYAWQGDGTASIVINTTETGYTLQYQVVGAESEIQENNWTEINSGETITGLVYGDTVYGRLWDGTNESEYANATIADDLPPQAATIDLSETTTDTEGSVTATVTMADNESGVDATESKWVYNTTSTNIGIDEASYTNSFTTNPEQITLQASTVETYYLHVLTKDVAGNKVETISEAITVEEAVVPSTTVEAKPNEGEDGPKFLDTTPITDDEGNSVTIPGGFHLDKDSGTSVEDGIVIEDSSGNQFVWIPVGTYQTRNGAKTNSLSRRTFTSSKATGVSGDSAINDNNSEYYYGEGYSSSIAKNQIQLFKNSVTSYGGFYIGRYEQGEGNVCKAGVNPYNNIALNQAKSQAEAMYNENNYVVSELISSYAWDTTLNFICQTNTAGYTLATTTSSSYGNINTGWGRPTGEYTADKYSNICDMLGNYYEWTTEYYSGDNGHCTIRGGNYKGNYAANRLDSDIDFAYGWLSFRIQLYIK